MNLLAYLKTIVAAVAAFVVSVSLAIQDHAITTEEWTAIATAWAGVLAVFAVANRPSA